jgi:hypothetical protein
MFSQNEYFCNTLPVGNMHILSILSSIFIKGITFEIIDAAIL